MWTEFMDMNSGGGRKEKWSYIYIEAPEDEAKVIFYNRFGHNPERVTCTCCGDDYSITEYEDLRRATAYQRGCKCGKDGYIEEPDRKYDPNKQLISLEDYIKQDMSLVVDRDSIKPEERKGDVPSEGYVWM